MQFLNPIWLWGLTGLVIPIGIHLLSRKEGKIIRIGSIRHLEETSTRQFRNVRLNELLLLALRCLLILLITFLLSGLKIIDSKSKDIHWLLIEKGIEKDADFKPLIDSLQKKDFEVRWFAKDFPLFKDSVALHTSMSYWSLAESLGAQNTTQTFVLAYNYVNLFKGKRITIPEHVQWIAKNSTPVNFTLSAVRLSSDTVMLRQGVSSSERASFATEYVKANSGQSVLDGNNAVPIHYPDTIAIALYSDPSFEYDQTILLAALKALDEIKPFVIHARTSSTEKWNPSDDTDWIIWLSEKEYPETERSNRIIYSEKELATTEVFSFFGSGWALNKRLNEDNALHQNLTLQLANIILPTTQLQQRANAFDKRTLPEKQLWSSAPPQENENKTALARTNNTLNYLVLLILLTLATERILAFKRNQ